jgi:Asp-tRNA(Asn)/Glu-tRNA(Gln) amidotransferase A subunit family amidase
VSSVDIGEAHLQRIEPFNPIRKAFAAATADIAREAARCMESEIGETGLPLSIPLVGPA